MSRVFLDTNILVYPHDHADAFKRARAEQVILTLKQSNHSPVISTQVLQEFYNTLTRKLGFLPLAAKREVLLLESLSVVALSPEIILAAIDLHATGSISFWDALIVAAAQSADCDELWTEDFNAGQTYGSLKVVNPFVGS